MVEDLVSRGLFINTWIAQDVEIEGMHNCLIIEHEKVDHLTLYYEWSFSMYKNALLMICQINDILLDHGLILMDPHGANVAFIGTRPVYLDFGSIQPLNSSTHKILFEDSFINILKMYKNDVMSQDKLRLPLLYMDGFNDAECARFKGFAGERIVKLKRKYDHICDCIDYRPVDSFDGMKKTIISILKVISKKSKADVIKREKAYYKKRYATYYKEDKSFRTYWGEYEEVYLEDSKVKDDKRVSFYVKCIEDLVSLYGIRDIFDAAGNSGVFAQALVERNVVDTAVVMDIDEGAIEAGYNRIFSKDDIRGKMTFLLGNVIYPYECKTRYKIREERLSCDIVIALAVSHHILLTQGISPGVFFKCIYEMCKKVAIVEFMPYGLWSGKKEDLAKVDVPEWYTLDWFTGQMSRYFEILKVEEVVENRIAVIGRNSTKNMWSCKMSP